MKPLPITEIKQNKTAIAIKANDENSAIVFETKNKQLCEYDVDDEILLFSFKELKYLLQTAKCNKEMIEIILGEK